MPTGDGDVGGLALQMLGIACTLHGGVELGASVAGCDLNGQAEVLTVMLYIYSIIYQFYT